MSKVTVLMPVYNAEEYLRKALDSVLGQTLDDIQIVCIDDASTDSSLRILNDYAKKDSRIKVMHLGGNHGQAYARNIGLTIADGEYIAMLDADDWLAHDALELAVNVFDDFPETDCVLMDLQYYWEPIGDITGYDWNYDTSKAHTLDDGSFEVMSGYDAFIASLDWEIHGVTIDRRSLYDKYPFDDSCRYYSDDNTVRLHYLASHEVRCCKGKYFYRSHASSVSNQISVGHMDWMRAADSLRCKLSEIGMSEEVMKRWEWERWKIIIGCYWFYFLHKGSFSPSDRQYCLSEIRKAWKGTDLARLKRKSILKLGYYPFSGHWYLFRLEESLYFYTRYILGRR